MRLSGPERGGAWVGDTITDEHGHRWTVEVWVCGRRGRLVVGELRVFPAAGPPRATTGYSWQGQPTDVPRSGLERRLVIKVPVGRYPAYVVARAATAPEGNQPAVVAGQGVNRAWLSKIVPGLETLTPRPRERRPVGRGDRYYAQLALEYLECVAAGSVRPVKDLATKRGEKVSRIRDQLHEARDRHLLSKGEAGRRGGYLLPRADQVLGREPRSTPSARRTR